MAQNKISLMKGMVVALKANYIEVELEVNSTNLSKLVRVQKGKSLRLLCTRRSRLTHLGSFPKVGDHVFVESIDWKELSAVVTGIQPRKSMLIRPPVANCTDIFVLISLSDPAIDFDQASRFLLTAEQVGINVHLILTKKDLIEKNQLNEYKDRFSMWGYFPITSSVKTGEGIDNLLLKLCSNKLSVLCGPSGVGKSSLIKYLLPKSTLRIGKLTKRLQRGRNTTRNVELYSISEGSFVADTPGFNRPELKQDPNLLPFLFPELRSQISDYTCKYRDCKHLDEPGCRMNKSWERYSQYKRFMLQMISYRSQYAEDLD